MGSYVPQIVITALAAVVILAGLIWVGLVTEAVFYKPCEPPPYWKCTPKGDWNDPNCKCWESK